MFAMMVDHLVHWHLDRHWLGDLNWHVLLHWYWHGLFNVVGNFLLHLVRYWFLHRDSDGLDNGDSNWVWYLYVDRIGLWDWHCYWFWNWDGNCVWNWDSLVLVHGNGYVLGDLHGVGDVVAASIMASVTAREAGIYGRDSAQERYIHLEEETLRFMILS